jgi:MATE family multidrug resistance protein
MTASSSSSIPLAAPPRVPPRAGGVREVVHLAWPLVLAQMSQTTMHVVDSIFVGQLGASQLGALGFAGIWLWTVFAIFSGSATGVQTFVSQAHGAGDERVCGSWAWQGLYALVPATAITLFLFAAVSEHLFAAVGAPASLREHALSYIAVRPLGFIGLIIWMVLAAFFRGLGDTRTPLIATLVANAVNIVLDYGLVLGRLGLPAWGIAGAGVATSIAEWVGVVVLAIAFTRPALVRRFGGRPVAPSRVRIRRFLRTGAPIGGQWVLDMSADRADLVAGTRVEIVAAESTLLKVKRI